MSLLVVNLGLPKSGTTTLARALRAAGLRVADYRVRWKQAPDPALRGKYVGDLLYRGYFETGDPGAAFKDFDAISETSVIRHGKSLWPQTDAALIRALRTYHPHLRFLASRRDSFEMSQSMLAWSDLGTSRLPENGVPGLPAGYGETTRERMQWIDGHYTTLRHMFSGSAMYLEYDTSDPEAPRKVGDFLGLDLPWWGKANVNQISTWKEAV